MLYGLVLYVEVRVFGVLVVGRRGVLVLCGMWSVGFSFVIEKMTQVSKG